jgi:hypothetical protein
MTVEELKEELSKYDDNQEVKLAVWYCNGAYSGTANIAYIAEKEGIVVIGDY